MALGTDRVRVATAAVSVLLAGIALELPARAQQRLSVSVSRELTNGPGSGRIGKRALEGYARILKFDDDQKLAASAMHDAYRQSLREANEAHMRAIRAMREDADEGPEQFEKMEAVEDQHGERLAQVEKKFFQDLKTLATEDQAARWGDVERCRRREVGLAGGMSVAGAGTDLVSIVDRLGLGEDQRGALAETLGRYEKDLDGMLLERQTLMDGRPRLTGQFDATVIQSLRDFGKQDRAIGFRVRDLTDQTAAKIATLLPEEKRESWDEQVKRSQHPRVYRTWPTEQMMGAALAMKDLGDAQRADVGQLWQKYRGEAGALGEKWVRAIREEDEDEGRGGTFALGGGTMIRMGTDGGPESKTKPIAKERRELDEQFLEKLKAILTKEQVAKLPEPTPDTDEYGGEPMEMD